jgi:serine/threonine protein kinase
MATVYLARDLTHERDVAVKVLRPELTAAVGSDRFLREVRITAQRDHPHILPPLDSGERVIVTVGREVRSPELEGLADRLAAHKGRP